MASLNMAVLGGLAATKGSSRVFFAKASKSTRGSGSGSGSVEEEKGPFDWIMAGLLKDQLVETDPVLQKVEEAKSPTSKTTSSVSIPSKKKFGGFGGLFAKN